MSIFGSLTTLAKNSFQPGFVRFLLFSYWIFLPSLVFGFPKDEIGYYVETYGEIHPTQNTQVARTYAIFKRVRAVADKNSNRLPKIVVVDGRNDAWIIALPDGNIVMSLRAIQIAHTEASTEESDARLAFILGHELAHLANNDFWHREVLSFLQSNTETQSIGNDLASRIVKRELAADGLGYVYAGIAGYPVELLIQRSSGNSEIFFDFWTKRTNVSSHYPLPKIRTAILQRRFKTIHDKLVFFNFGVRLSHFDFCDDAVYFFREFLKDFPGREVLNNLGYCYLQMARQTMAQSRAYFYWMPLILDSETRAVTRAVSVVRRSGEFIKSLRQVSDGKGAGFLEEAKEYLMRAADADPLYLPARTNLAVVYLYLGKPHKARAILKEALALSPDNPEIQGLEALAIYEQSDSELDLWPNAVAKLKKLVNAPNASSELLFNLARLLAARPRAQEARHYWNRIVTSGQALPESIRSIVCSVHSENVGEFCDLRPPYRDPENPWRWPLEIGGYERFSNRQLESQLPTWRSTSFDWFKGGLHGHIFNSPDETKEVLEINGYVQMQVIKMSKLPSQGDIQGLCPRPLRKREIYQGVIWTCNDWAALESNNGFHQVWRVTR